ncbi:MAG TPA: hypothetical protein VHC18_21320 [Amycolatopsis sp.]|nr:hypothetical protein [Amycolatopsis sp.]
MRTMRILLALPGLAALGFGAWLFVGYAAPAWPDSLKTLVWLAGAPVVNDAVLAPVAGLAGLLLARLVPVPWRAPVQAGAVITAVLTFLAFPLLWRPFGAPPSPGLHDDDPGTGLLVTLAVVWGLVAITGTVRAVLAHRNVRSKGRSRQT